MLRVWTQRMAIEDHSLLTSLFLAKMPWDVTNRKTPGILVFLLFFFLFVTFQPWPWWRTQHFTANIALLMTCECVMDTLGPPTSNHQNDIWTDGCLGYLQRPLPVQLWLFFSPLKMRMNWAQRTVYGLKRGVKAWRSFPWCICWGYAPLIRHCNTKQYQIQFL